VWSALLAAGACSNGSSNTAPTVPPPWWKGVAVTNMQSRDPLKSGELSRQTVKVAVEDNVFSPSVLAVDPGTTVVWTNLGTNVHNIAPAIFDQDYGGSRFGVDKMPSAAEYNYRFTKPGVYRYYCTFHGSADQGMVGLVAVGNVDINSTAYATTTSTTTSSGSAP
jgi:plastocyanin